VKWQVITVYINIGPLQKLKIKIIATVFQL